MFVCAPLCIQLLARVTRFDSVKLAEAYLIALKFSQLPRVNTKDSVRLIASCKPGLKSGVPVYLVKKNLPYFLTADIEKAL